MSKMIFNKQLDLVAHQGQHAGAERNLNEGSRVAGLHACLRTHPLPKFWSLPPRATGRGPPTSWTAAPPLRLQLKQQSVVACEETNNPAVRGKYQRGVSESRQISRGMGQVAASGNPRTATAVCRANATDPRPRPANDPCAPPSLQRPESELSRMDRTWATAQA